MYGAKIIEKLSQQLNDRFGRGYSIANLKNFRQFYLTSPQRGTIRYTAGSESVEGTGISYTPCSESFSQKQHTAGAEFNIKTICFLIEESEKHQMFNISRIRVLSDCCKDGPKLPKTADISLFAQVNILPGSILESVFNPVLPNSGCDRLTSIPLMPAWLVMAAITTSSPPKSLITTANTAPGRLLVVLPSVYGKSMSTISQRLMAIGMDFNIYPLLLISRNQKHYYFVILKNFQQYPSQLFPEILKTLMCFAVQSPGFPLLLQGLTLLFESCGAPFYLFIVIILAVILFELTKESFQNTANSYTPSLGIGNPAIFPHSSIVSVRSSGIFSILQPGKATITSCSGSDRNTTCTTPHSEISVTAIYIPECPCITGYLKLVIVAKVPDSTHFWVDESLYMLSQIIVALTIGFAIYLPDSLSVYE